MRKKGALRYMRSFDQAFSIHHALRDESRSADNVNAPRSELPEVRPKGETLWLSLNQIATLFDRDKSVVSRHLRNVFETKELDRKAVVAFFATTAADGKTYQVEFFNLDAVLSVGYLL